MDSSYAQHPQMGQSPFFYYNPDPKPDNRQHGHFSQHPAVQVQVYSQHVQMPSTPIYSRPSSSCSQPPMHQGFNPAYASNMTPMASPRPMYQKPTILIQDHSPRMMFDDNDVDMYYYPQTPPLSTSGSTMGSPTSCDVLPTPINSMFCGLEGFEGVKEGCEGEVQSENLAGGDWARCGSPPMTPVFIHPPSLMSNANELLSATSCPSLSPSPSPYPRSNVSEADVDFCDPRNLIVGTAPTSNPTLSVEYPLLPTLCPGDEEEHRYMLGNDYSKSVVSPESTFDFSITSQHGLPSFDALSDLDSEDDFVNGLVNFQSTGAENVHFLGHKRQRTSSDLLALEPESFISEDDFEDFDDSEQFAVACLPSPPASGSDGEMQQNNEKRNKRSKKSQSVDEDSSEFDAMVRSRKFKVSLNTSCGASVQETSADAQQGSTAPSNAGSSENTNSGNIMGSGSDAGAPQQAPVNRRGRKQSLTEDPSKTFVCDLCNRRFRRQEHLKRHYRSLHTQEKPFECSDCGKKFSRSDNLSQHARTHGAGSMVMGVLEDGELPGDMESNSETELRQYGRTLFSVAASADGSMSSNSSQDGSDSSSRKKRKRTSE